jgi:hypothetical protein
MAVSVYCESQQQRFGMTKIVIFLPFYISNLHFRKPALRGYELGCCKLCTSFTTPRTLSFQTRFRCWFPSRFFGWMVHCHWNRDSGKKDHTSMYA